MKTKELKEEIEFLKKVGNGDIKRRSLLFVLKHPRWQILLIQKQAELKGKTEATQECIKIIEKLIIRNPHLFSVHKGKIKKELSSCKVCEVLEKLKLKLEKKNEGKTLCKKSFEN